MAQIRYLAALSEDPDRLAGFYGTRFGMSELGRSNEGDVSLSDGFYNFTVFKNRAGLKEPRKEIGLHHIGLQVDSISEVRNRYLKFNPRGTIVPEPGGLHHGEVRIYDPEMNPVTLSERPFGVTDEERRFPRIVHIAFDAMLPETLMTFYCDVLGLREVASSFTYRSRGKLNRFCGDGTTNLAIHPFYSEAIGHEQRFGVQHFGVLVDDIKDKLADLEGDVPLAKRPDDRPFAEFRLRDPDNNGVDLSQGSGWEVDFDKWDKVA